MKTKPIFLYGLGQSKKDFAGISKYVDIPFIDWNNSKVVPKLKKVDNLIGFSLGCMVACIHAEKHPVKNLVLCSMSPDETLSNIKAENVIFLVGEKENWVRLNIARVINTLKNINWSIIVVPGATHKRGKKYQKYLLDIIKSL